MKRFLLLAIGVFLALNGATFADVRVKSTIKMEGVIGLMNSEGETELMISGEKGKSISTIKMTNKVMKFLGAGKPQETVAITRLDEEVFWDLNIKDKKYTEKTFAQVRAEIEKALEDSRKERAKAAKKNPEDSLKYATTIDVKKTGKTEIIAGHAAEQYIITMSTYGKSKEGGSGMFRVVLDSWHATAVGEEEYTAFYTKLAEKMSSGNNDQKSPEGVLVGFGIDPSDLGEKMKEVKGPSLRTIMTITMAGEGEEEQAAASELLIYIAQATEVSTAAIAGTEFEVPEGFKLKK